MASRSALTLLGKQLSNQKVLAEQIKALLPSPLNEHIHGAVMHTRTLSLFVNSPVWASRLRYLAPELLRQLRQQGLIIDRVRTKIVAQEASKTNRRSGWKRLSLSEKSAEILRQTAVALEDKPLREAMLRLSRHGQRKRPD
ncbi:MAG: DUF721 domain-containing protein [Candidatus Thiodiazotropha sp. (ex Notomyrtea botanica)]|nr:DUF721 domain-containing protein [Candidatus Thiodiazotropha sp. (ex Notomyrtea botanica)]